MHSNFQKYFVFIDKFDKLFLDRLPKNIFLIYRIKNNNYNLKTLTKLEHFCKMKSRKLYISNNIKLAIKLNLDGAYIPSFNSNKKHLSYSVKKNFILLGSAHNVYEMRTKELQRVNAIFLSSIFKKNKNYLGINKFKLLSNLTNNKVIALGGIANKNLKKLKLVKCFGFAGISFFE